MKNRRNFCGCGRRRLVGCASRKRSSAGRRRARARRSVQEEGFPKTGACVADALRAQYGHAVNCPATGWRFWRAAKAVLRMPTGGGRIPADSKVRSSHRDKASFLAAVHSTLCGS